MYGGTRAEMERLLSDAQKLTGVKYDINNLSDVYNAIHAIQGELGITGTTAKRTFNNLDRFFWCYECSVFKLARKHGIRERHNRKYSTSFFNIRHILCRKPFAVDW